MEAIIPICKKCGKIDRTEGDGHSCNRAEEERRQEDIGRYYD